VTALAEALGTLRADGESGGSDLGRRALELIIGPNVLRAAVDNDVAAVLRAPRVTGRPIRGS
jgi:hypothetical protein